MFVGIFFFLSPYDNTAQNEENATHQSEDKPWNIDGHTDVLVDGPRCTSQRYTHDESHENYDTPDADEEYSGVQIDVPGFLNFLAQIIRKEMNQNTQHEDTNPPTHCSAQERKSAEMRRLTNLNPWEKEASKDTRDTHDDDFHAPRRFRKKEPDVF